MGETYVVYEPLLRTMFDKDFIWIIPNDDNRVADGLELRSDFCYELYAENMDICINQFTTPGSFLEVLIGLSRRLSFMADGSPEEWAWQLMTNLKLDNLSGPLSQSKRKRAEEIMDACIWRTYEPTGVGGFFPLSHTKTDQRQIELWYQMADYIDELSMEQ